MQTLAHGLPLRGKPTTNSQMKKTLFSAACVVTCCMGNPAQARCVLIEDFASYQACKERESAIEQQQWEIQRLRDRIDSIELDKALDEAFYSF